MDYKELFFKISDKIDCIPVIHGDGIFSEIVINRMLNKKYEALAVPLPVSMYEPVIKGIDYLPEIYAAVYRESSGRCGYVAISPCSSVIMAVKIAIQERIPVYFIDYETDNFKEDNFVYPDSFPVRTLSIEKYAAAVTSFAVRPSEKSQVKKRINYMANQLHILELDHSRILFIPSIQHWLFIKEAYDDLHKPPEETDFFPDVNLYKVEKNSLSFILGELPFFEYIYERDRTLNFKDEFSPPDCIKELLIETRKKYLEKTKKVIEDISPKLFQIMLTYIRNLTLIRGRLTPDLYTLIIAAKQTAGDDFAIDMAETAKSYPIDLEKNIYIPEILGLEGNDTLFFSIDQVILPGGVKTGIFNRLDGRKFLWKNVKLKKRRRKEYQKKYKQLWNPYKMCSYPPEDIRIESFNTHIRQQTQALIGEGMIKSVKFTTSFMDGLDIRETLRNWYNKDIYVKDIPPSRGSIEVVLIFFEYPLDHEKYTWKTTWYAEHNQESTLCLIATDFKENLIGPGIGRATYGAVFMIFPPRYIPDIWKDPEFNFAKSSEAKLAAAALYHSQEKYVTLISPRPPNLMFKRIAKKYKKKWIYIPLKRFSGRLVRRLREVHVLNGKEVRSYASDYITGFLD